MLAYEESTGPPVICVLMIFKYLYLFYILYKYFSYKLLFIAFTPSLHLDEFLRTFSFIDVIK